ncbi:hypothetical protein M0804_006421 [Polistes exclamans]|nr:hypothetical protein M0804_006421 [Polistes exclamans]
MPPTLTKYGTRYRVQRQHTRHFEPKEISVECEEKNESGAGAAEIFTFKNPNQLLSDTRYEKFESLDVHTDVETRLAALPPTKLVLREHVNQIPAEEIDEDDEDIPRNEFFDIAAELDSDDFNYEEFDENEQEDDVDK